MRALLVTRKSLLELAREWQLLLLVVLVPLAFLGMTAAGYSSPLLMTHRVLVAADDPAAAPLVAELVSQRYADGRPVFEIERASDLDAAEDALKDRRAAALVIISPAVGSVTIKGDALNGRLYRASTILESVVSRHAGRAAGIPEVVRLVEEPLGKASPQSEFDIYAPGMIVFALMLITPQTAMLLGREMRWNTLRRLRLTRLRAWELLAGVSGAQAVVAVLQVLLLFLSALAMGFHNQGSLTLAILTGLALSTSAIGLGLIVACFVEDDSQAINVGSVVSMIQVFFSGCFYQLPPLTVLTLAGHPIDLFDVFPATHGFLALQQVLSYGAGLREIGFRLTATLALSALTLAAGVIVFQRRQMQSRAS